MLQKLKSWFAPDPLDAPARALYHRIVEQARRPEFFDAFAVPDTANGRFDMIVLHCYCVMRRLKKSPEGYDLSQMLATVLVDDLDRNLREMGVGDLSVGKKVKRIAEGFYGRLDAYDAAFEETEDEALSEALRRNIYSSLDDPPTDGVAAMVSYFRREVAAVDEVDLERLALGEVTFGAPTFS
ncbi:MAG TPA: ubiquinol-cytochrome C chaperone [Rhodospirillaceae bacterium]|nr:ubiquinol-cytochrome C chaperone [Rhodospirillaceae bacterium]HAA91305.1 ubiquinol-cytochrome C chaperone [Rhodospirillaceae bacterium]HAT35768.1 ubiquinol-cytochrome C chaperone [Rhodospirillaceae bacterium]|tara:strand:- start:607 stop:1155 length:549 start_codon:yes stop_codon:yes gene_type:complete